MSGDRYGQGQGSQDQLLRHIVLSGQNEGGARLSSSNFQQGPAQPEQQLISQGEAALSYPSVNQHQDSRIQPQLQAEHGHTTRKEEKMAFTQLAAANILQGHGASPEHSPGLDGQSLYCTEVLPSASPPSQPITVEGGGTSRRGLVAVNGGAGSQPVQYTIIITDPQLQQNNSGSNNNNTGATSILLNTLVKQQQQQQQQLQQQQLQLHLASISKANNLLASVPQTNANFLVNTSNVNGSNKLSTLLINNNNLSSGSGSTNNASTFPANLITNNISTTSVDSKNNQNLNSVALSANNKILPTVLDSAAVEGGFVILNYSDPSLPAGSATITSINQLVSLQSRASNNAEIVLSQNPAHLVQAADESNSAVGNDRQRHSAGSKTTVCKNSDISQVDTHPKVDARDTVLYNGPVLSKETSGSVHTNKEPLTPAIQLLSPGEQQIEATSSSDRVSGGMHSGRTGAGSGQAHTTHPQQQQRHSPISSSSTASAASPNQAAMLSAGQPAVPSGIFRTGSDNSSPSHRLLGSGSSSYVPAQYPTMYGIHGQSPGHLGTIPPYSTFFPAGFGGSGASSHGFSHSSMMTGTAPGPFPRVESYSAMLASMGSHAQHHGPQAAERSPRVQAPSVSLPQRPATFLPTAAHMTAPGSQYPSIPTSSHRRLSGSSSSSPGPAAASHNPQTTSTRLDPLSSHHLEKMAAIKGATSLQAREGEASRDLRLYGESPSLHEDKPNLSPPGTYSASGHAPKVSFDTVVKEYGGGRDSPTGRGEAYFRASLSGKEGSLKHRILTRPSDSDVADDMSKVTGIHGLKEEPVSKRPKFASVGSASSSYGLQTSPGHMGESQRTGSRHHTVSHATSHHSLPNNNNNNNTVDNRGSGTNYPSDNNLTGRQGQPPSPLQPHQGQENNSGMGYRQPSYHSTSPSPPAPAGSPSESSPSHLQYPSHFMKGSIIQLATGSLKRVEDLQTEDFVNSAEISSDLKVDSSTVVRIEEHPERGTAMLSFSVGEHRVQVTVEATLEHPFFVFGQGWSSCSVSRTLARYGLDCQKLNVGDVCISLTHKDVNLKAAEISQHQQQQQQHEQSYPDDSHSKQTTSAGPSTSDNETLSPLSTSSAALPSSTPPASSSSNVSSSLKQESTDMNYLPPLSSSSVPTNRRRLSQTELPPPSTNIVPVKKESNNGHNVWRKTSQRVEEEMKEEDVGEQDDSDSTSSLNRKRRWSAPDPVMVKAEQERERERQMLANEAQKAEEAGSTDNGRQ